MFLELHKILSPFQTTGLAGLKVVTNPEHRLQVVYGKVLRALQRIPPQAAYRKYTEELVNTRLQIVKEVNLHCRNFKIASYPLD